MQSQVWPSNAYDIHLSTQITAGLFHHVVLLTVSDRCYCELSFLVETMFKIFNVIQESGQD